MDLPPSGSHHRRRSSVLTSSGGASQPRPATAENQEENSRSGPVDRDGPRGEEQKPLNAKDRDSSDLSSVAESEELEMDYIPSDDDLNDDEETGLTARQRSERRRRRRRQRRQLDARIAGVKASRKDGRKLADKNVIKKLLINALLIGLWYFFSLSISIVSLHVFLYLSPRTDHVTCYSTTNGCSPKTPSYSRFPCLQPVCTWLYSSLSHP